MMKNAIVRNPRRLEADDRAAEVDAETVLDNVVELDKLLDDGNSRREVDSLPVLELSKHMRVRSTETGPKIRTEPEPGSLESSSSVATVEAETATES